jgi:ribosome-associated heat shock protein Hsp15
LNERAARADEAADALRIDRWLWCARFYKTRSLAATEIKTGRVRVNGQRVEPAHALKVGDRLEVDRGEVVQEVTVADIPKRRGPGAEAQRCYAETAESLERRRLAAERRAAEPRIEAPTAGRPDKRTRRLLLRARQRATDSEG